MGEYAIRISGGEAQNYSFKYVDGILTIIEASGIEEIVDSEQPITVYTLFGKKIKVPSLKSLHRGIYIVNGHKFVKNR